MIKPLEIGEYYSRENVANIFSPSKRYIAGAGTWGIQGIVKIPERDGDFVFFVTYGQHQGEYAFDESISRQGVLNWQSQPSQSLQHKTIIQLINHNSDRNHIYLFLRLNKRSNYIYLGELGYLCHDIDREKPVYFQWQLLDWFFYQNKFPEMMAVLSRNDGTEKVASETPSEKLVEVLCSNGHKTRAGYKTKQFLSRKIADYSKFDAIKNEIGNISEKLVLEYERDSLISLGREDLAKKVFHTSSIEGDGAGYDILSFDEFGNKKYIEVKGTEGEAATSFYMSINERAFMEAHLNCFYIYRVFNLNHIQQSGYFFKISGDELARLVFEPIQFRVNV